MGSVKAGRWGDNGRWGIKDGGTLEGEGEVAGGPAGDHGGSSDAGSNNRSSGLVGSLPDPGVDSMTDVRADGL